MDILCKAPMGVGRWPPLLMACNWQLRLVLGFLPHVLGSLTLVPRSLPCTLAPSLRGDFSSSHLG